jgi:signal transduction histidine kinase
MFFARLRRAPRTVGFRLAVWSSTVYIASTVVLFALAYVLVSSSVQQRDRESIQLELSELAALYRGGGLPALAQELALQERLETTEPFLVRVVDPGKRAPFVMAPDRWIGFDLDRLDSGDQASVPDWTFLPARRGDKALEVASLRMPDGAIMQVGKTTDDRVELLERFRANVARAVIPLLVLSLTGGLFLASWALRPVRQIIQTVRAIEAGEMHARVPTRQTGDELDELGRLFNGMLDRIATLIAGMRGALDTVAHDLRTPVTRIRGVAELALRADEGSDASRQALADCVEESDQLLTLLNTLMDISEAETGMLKLRLERVNVADLVEDTVDLYRHVAEEKRIAVTTATIPDLWLTADRSRLRQILANLLDNAIKYTPAGGRVEMKAHLQAGTVVFNVKDTGIGLTPDEVPRIWDRLYRSDQSRSERGLGLGLSLVRAVVHAHGGQIGVSSAIGVGSTFTMSLPLSTATPR